MSKGRARAGAAKKSQKNLGPQPPQKHIFWSNLGHFERKFAENCPIFTKIVHFFLNFSHFSEPKGVAYASTPPPYLRQWSGIINVAGESSLIGR